MRQLNDIYKELEVGKKYLIEIEALDDKIVYTSNDGRICGEWWAVLNSKIDKAKLFYFDLYGYGNTDAVLEGFEFGFWEDSNYLRIGKAFELTTAEEEAKFEAARMLYKIVK